MAGGWQGEPHVLVVTAVTPPGGPFGHGTMDYEIRHPEGCPRDLYGWAAPGHEDWSCPVAEIAREGLECSLRYSGTPVTVEGRYEIRAWRAWHQDGHGGCREYDDGIRVTGPAPA